MVGEFHREGDRRVREHFSPSLPLCDVDHRRDADGGCRPGGRGLAPPLCPRPGLHFLIGLFGNSSTWPPPMPGGEGPRTPVAGRLPLTSPAEGALSSLGGARAGWGAPSSQACGLSSSTSPVTCGESLWWFQRGHVISSVFLSFPLCFLFLPLIRRKTHSGIKVQYSFVVGKRTWFIKAF